MTHSRDSLLVGVLAAGEAYGFLAKGADQRLEILVPGRRAPVTHVAAVGKTERPCRVMFPPHPQKSMKGKGKGKANKARRNQVKLRHLREAAP